MRRALVLAPLALYSAACALEPPMPASDPTHVEWPEPPPAIVAPPFEVASRVDTISHWQLPAGSAWSRFEKLTLAASLGAVPKANELPDVSRADEIVAARAAASSVAEGRLPEDTMWIVDLHGAASVVFGATLSQRSLVPIANVLTFNNWPADDELIPAVETLSALVHMTPRLPHAGDAARPVFLLDGWRLAFKGLEPDEEKTDNRYYLTPSDLPDAAQLAAAGIKRIMYVVPSVSVQHEEDDLHAIFLAYQRAGISIYMVDVAGLTRRVTSSADDIPEPPPDQYLNERYLWIEERVTVIDEPYSYGLSRGGFGGDIWVGGGGGGGHAHHIGGHGVGVGWGGGGG